MTDFIVPGNGRTIVTSVLVPFGTTPDAAGAHRGAVWRWCARRWQRLVDTGVVDEVVVGHDPLFGRVDFERPYATYPLDAKAPGPHPFSVARALNNAAKHARGSRFLLFGADHVPDARAIEWGLHQLRGYAFARIYERVAYATEGATRIILSDRSFPLDAADWRIHSAPCPGVLALRRSAWDTAGGLDEQFEGWGYEDTEFLDRLVRAHQNGVRGTMGPSGYTLRELWHDGGARDLDGRNRALYEGRRP